jgi:hypothetical protein
VAEDRRFREVQRYADVHGFFAGFPNFHEADYGDGVVHGTILLRDTEAEWGDVLRSDLGDPPIDDLSALFRAVDAYASQQGYPHPLLRQRLVRDDRIPVGPPRCRRAVSRLAARRAREIFADVSHKRDGFARYSTAATAARLRLECTL